MLKIKEEHVGKRIAKGNDVIILTRDLSQQKLLYVKNMISSEFIEEICDKCDNYICTCDKEEMTMEKAAENVEAYIKSSSKKYRRRNG